MSGRRTANTARPRGTEQSWRSRARGRGMSGSTPEPSGGTSTRQPGLANVRPSLMQSSRAPVASASSNGMSSRRRMDLMASVSRSSGLEKDGDDLKNPKIQEEYRNFIQEKVDDVLENHPRSTTETDTEKRHGIDAQQNLLILFRKLREGVASSGRRDAFALEAYEISLYLSIVFESPTQTTSVIPHLFPSRFSERPEDPSFLSGSPSMYSILGSLLHQLVTFYPSQGRYDQQLHSLSKSLLPKGSTMSRWLQSLAKSLRTRNYVQFALLSNRSAIEGILDVSEKPSQDSEPTSSKSLSLKDLGLKATLILVDALRQKVSDDAWAVIRSAYRELSCDQAAEETKIWLGRSLCLESVVTDDQHPNIEGFLDKKAHLGHVRKKEGVEGRWIVCKAR